MYACEYSWMVQAMYALAIHDPRYVPQAICARGINHMVNI